MAACLQALSTTPGISPSSANHSAMIFAKSISPFEKQRDFPKPNNLNNTFMIFAKSIDYPSYDLINIFWI